MFLSFEWNEGKEPNVCHLYLPHSFIRYHLQVDMVWEELAFDDTVS